MSPMTGRFATGTAGGMYRGLTAYSYMMKTNDAATDLIARVEVPWDPMELFSLGVDPSNTYVGKLSADNQSWALNDLRTDVNM